MSYGFSLSGSPSKFLIEAAAKLKKEGQEIFRTLPNGTTVKFIRGKDIDARGFGQKYQLFKEVTRPDNSRFVTSANIIRDDVFINEMFYIEPTKTIPNYIMHYDKYYYMSPGGFRVQEANGLDMRSDILKQLLRKKLPPKEASSGRRAHAPNDGHKTQSTNKQQSTNNSTGGKSSYSSYEDYSRKAQGAYSQQKARTAGQHTSSAGKITKDQFINLMLEKFSRLKSKELIEPKTLKDSEIRNLAKLFGIDEATVRNFDKKTKRNLTLKFHPDTNGGDETSIKICQIVNKLKAA